MRCAQGAWGLPLAGRLLLSATRSGPAQQNAARAAPLPLPLPQGLGLKQKPSQELATTTFVHRIFGGRLRSQVWPPGPLQHNLSQGPLPPPTGRRAPARPARQERQLRVASLLCALLLRPVDLCPSLLLCLRLPQIKCEGVDYESNKYDPFLDLSLEINQVRTHEHANANGMRMPACNRHA